VSALAVAYTMLEVPFRIAFQGGDTQGTGTETIGAIVIAIFWIDVLVSLNTPYESTVSRMLVVDRERIAKRYFRFWGWIDVLSAIPFDTIAASTYDA
jgi:hypothetical protein